MADTEIWEEKKSGATAEIVEVTVDYVWYRKPGRQKVRIKRLTFLEKWRLVEDERPTAPKQANHRSPFGMGS